jgi:cobalamin synthase
VVGCLVVETFFPTVTTFPLRLTVDDFGQLLLCIAMMLASSCLLLWGLVKRTEALNGDLLGALVCISEVFLTIYILKVF